VIHADGVGHPGDPGAVRLQTIAHVMTRSYTKPDGRAITGLAGDPIAMSRSGERSRLYSVTMRFGLAVP